MTKSQLTDEDRFICEQITDRLKEIDRQIAKAAAAAGRNKADIAVMAVTKTIAPIYVNFAVKQGKIRLLGENKAQELSQKYDSYLLKWENIHFIGHLQTNKVKQVIDKVNMIESVDSLKLAEEIEKQAERINRKIDVLLEINVGHEPSKSGILPEHIQELAQTVDELPHIRLRGLMAIPPKENAERYFEAMQMHFQRLKETYAQIDTLSMGMSGDYPLAVRYGATQIRLGSAIFGPRNYGESFV